jgi:hypothetical protein
MDKVQKPSNSEILSLIYKLLGLILERWDGVIWNGLVWLWIGTGGELV